MNSNWNYGYLHDDAGDYGFLDPLSLAAGAVAAVSGAVGAGISAKSQREQAKSDEQLARLQLLQSKQDAATSDSMLKVALAKSTQESAAQTEIAKNVMLGLAAVAVIGGLIYLSKDLLKAPPEA
jgi:hypothetical protein